MRRTAAVLAVVLLMLLAGCGARAQARLALEGRDTATTEHGAITISPQSPSIAEPEPAPSDSDSTSNPGNTNPGRRPDPTPPVRVARPRPPMMVALTFDDGPARYTEQILDLLEEHGGHATFFVLGYRVEGWRNTILRAHRAGNEVAGHTWSHPRLIYLDDQEIMNELLTTRLAIGALVGYVPFIFRPPFGQTNDDVERVARSIGYSLVNWTLDTRDWYPPNRCADHVYNSVMNGVEDGSIVVMHDIYASTADAMERVIPALIARGYTLVTVSELLYHLYGDLVPGRVYGHRQ